MYKCIQRFIGMSLFDMSLIFVYINVRANLYWGIASWYCFRCYLCNPLVGIGGRCIYEDYHLSVNEVS